jgi:hypothetical protein
MKESSMKIGVVLILFVSLLAIAGEPQTGPSGKIIVQNYYYAKPGKVEEVYEWRIHASDVREKLGLRRGRVLKHIGGSGKQPDVIWECEYPDIASRDAELKSLEKNAEFDSVMEHMSTLIDHFDRAMWQVEQGR